VAYCEQHLRRDCAICARERRRDFLKLVAVKLAFVALGALALSIEWFIYPATPDWIIGIALVVALIGFWGASTETHMGHDSAGS
jgi:hypothetical protein